MNLPLRPEVEQAFFAALEVPVAEQSAFLAREYAANPELCAEVESLLRDCRAAGELMEPGPGDASRLIRAAAARTPLSPPSSIGRYRIIRLLGEGGMGAVYEAEQDQPRRTVALKVIKAGLGGPELLRRFEHEFQALGRLQHPGIAQIYDAGSADSGCGLQPYFAMEFIRGASLLRYAEVRQLKPRGRLELMAKICEAVHHAHQRGIIHRDLKPGNILVDETGQPKILDFGVARLTDSDALATRETDVGRLVGTLAYMSPEQVLADPLELDTRSDVYALGVVLFELLAGRLPYQVSRNLHEAVQTIREEDPTRLSSVSRSYRGDIETIVAKALEKDKARRYSSAADLAADIHRYLRDEPIIARPPSAAYQARKFARRHTALVAGVGAVFVVLTAGIIVSMWEAALARDAAQAALHERDRAAAAEQAATRDRDRALSAERNATSERNRAIAAETQAVRDRNRAVAEKERADTESATAKAINDFLQHDLLAQASASVQARPDTKPDPDLKVRTALDRAAQQITGRFDREPLVEASIRQTIGGTYRDLGLFPEAQRQMDRALELRQRVLGGDHQETLNTMRSLADLYQVQGKYPQAEALYAKVLESQRRARGEEHPDTLNTMNSLALLYVNQGKYAQAEPLSTRVVEARRRVMGDENPETLSSMTNLAMLYDDRGKYGQAEPLLIKIIDVERHVLGEEHPDRLNGMNNLGMVYVNQGKFAQAEPLFTKVLEVRRRVLGDEHPNTLTSMNNLALLYVKQNKYEKAEPFFTSVFAVQRRLLGEDHHLTMISMNNLGVLYRNQGKYAQAEPLLTKVVEIERRVLGEEHPDSLSGMNNLARLYLNQGRHTEAQPLFTKILEVRRRVLGEEHPSTLLSMYNLAALYESQDEPAKAEALYSKVLAVRHRVLGPEHPDTIVVLASLGRLRMAERKYAEAEALLREALAGQEKKDASGWQRYDIQSMLGATLAAQGKFADAEPLLAAGYQGLTERKSTIPFENRSATEQAGERVVRLYQDWSKPEIAAEWRERTHRAKEAGRLP